MYPNTSSIDYQYKNKSRIKNEPNHFLFICYTLYEQVNIRPTSGIVPDIGQNSQTINVDDSQLYHRNYRFSHTGNILEDCYMLHLKL